MSRPFGCKLTNEHKRRIGVANSGKKRTLETRLLISSQLRTRVGEKAHHWLGDNVGYSGVHVWVRKMLGRPSYCEFCETTTAKRFEWANKSKKYKRDLSDWIRLCKKCHMIFDNVMEKCSLTKRIKNG